MTNLDILSAKQRLDREFGGVHTWQQAVYFLVASKEVHVEIALAWAVNEWLTTKARIEGRAVGVLLGIPSITEWATVDEITVKGMKELIPDLLALYELKAECQQEVVETVRKLISKE